MHLPFRKHYYFLILSLAFMLVTLAWSSPAYCGPIHDAAKNGDLGKVKALLKSNPDLIFSKEDGDIGDVPCRYSGDTIFNSNRDKYGVPGN